MLIKRASLHLSALVVVALLSGCAGTQIENPRVVVPIAPTSILPAPVVPLTKPDELLRPVAFAALPGWDKDDLREAWPAFMASCDVLIKKIDWKEVCSVAKEVSGADAVAVRLFFESFFLPYQVVNPDGTDTGLITGYYEPLLHGSRKRGGVYQNALYGVPDDLLIVDLASVYPELKGMRLRGRLSGKKIVPYPSRAEMAMLGSANGKELLWVDDPVEAFFLQVQGSGRVQLDNSRDVVRVSYADQNGYPYKSIGRYLVERGELALDQASAQGVKAWLLANPSRQQELLNANPSYVFFKEEKLLDPKVGPKGALGVPLTQQRSIAVDSQYVTMGAPVYLATTQPNGVAPLQQLVLAQDTGGAIKGAVRADFFWGFGSGAGAKAGKMKQRGLMWVLLPRVVPPR